MIHGTQKTKKPVMEKPAKQLRLWADTGRLITRAEARRIAERHVLRRVFGRASVREGEEAPGRHLGRREDTWVVYKKTPELMLCSSEIVVVCKRTGKVLYEGSANDEG